jgi:hypothetical protein
VSEGKPTCKGSLDLYTEADDGSFGVASFKAAKYPKFYKRMKKKSIVEIEVKGDCCWELYPRKQFNGIERSVVLKSGLHRAKIQPKSIRKASCF